ncbi:cytidine deaminase [Actinomadura rugatobispora]|uniref:Cytidine deaminase n=1 Tax=Actinomadura rugatobispora TaxID=1994 RepID=A0ABW0ZX23_9ACTN|nr:hypothetical protein GCM10010200_017200 [Actinomadura rugatobispora]
MIETERRFRLNAPETEALKSAIEFSSPIRLTDITFGPHGAQSMDKDGWIVRLRLSGDKARIEHKRKLPDSRWQEIGLAVDAPGSAVRLLTAMGLRPGLLIRRLRSASTFKGAELALDDLDGLGTFLEVEFPRETAGDRTLHETVAGLQALGVSLTTPAPPYGDQINAAIEQREEFAHEHDRRMRELLTELGGDPAVAVLTKTHATRSAPSGPRENYERALRNRGMSYCRYSSYPVGAVAVAADGRIFDGCSVENGSFGLTICAERAALTAAVLGGSASTAGREITAIVVAGPDGRSCSPCGACRQFIAELAPDADVTFWWEGELVTVSARDLMPMGYVYE